MKIVLIGEAAKHKSLLEAKLAQDTEFLCLPAKAAIDTDFDSNIDIDDILITLRFSRSKSDMPKFKLLHVPGAGLDAITIDTIQPETTVCNVYEHEIAIAEYVALALLNNEIKIAEMQHRFKTEQWGYVYSNRTPHGELHNKTIGLIGFGRIAKSIAIRLKAFGTNILTTDIHDPKQPELIDKFIPINEIESLLANSDYVIVTCPLNEATKGMLGTQQLAQMRKTAVIVNVSRGPIIDEAALYKALKNNSISGAILDVWYYYPQSSTDNIQPSKYPFQDLPNVVCTPHSCAWTNELVTRRYSFIAKNIQRLLDGKPLLNIVKEK